MKNLICLLLSALLSCAAAAQSTYYVAVDYTPAAASAGCGSAAISDAFSQSMTAINNQGVTTQLAAIPIAARQPLPDSSSMGDQFKWMQTNALAWADRTNAQSVAGFVVSAAASGVQAVIPNVPPIAVKDATAAINCGNMQYQMQQALAHVMGTTDAMGVQVRQRTYDGTNVCFHTQGAAKSDPNEYLPYLSGYCTQQPGNSSCVQPQTNAGDPTTSCSDYFYFARANGNPQFTSVSYSGGTCTIKNGAGAIVSQSSTVSYPAPPGSSTITCPNGNTDEEIPYYSCYGSDCAVISAYQGFAIGSPTQNAVGAMKARTATVYGLKGGNATMLSNANAGFFSNLLNMLF